MPAATAAGDVSGDVKWEILHGAGVKMRPMAGRWKKLFGWRRLFAPLGERIVCAESNRIGEVRKRLLKSLEFK